jgi:hypothetical protein
MLDLYSPCMTPSIPKRIAKPKKRTVTNIRKIMFADSRDAEARLLSGKFLLRASTHRQHELWRP